MKNSFIEDWKQQMIERGAEIKKDDIETKLSEINNILFNIVKKYKGTTIVADNADQLHSLLLRINLSVVTLFQHIKGV
jgi:hypothetical protein